MDPHEVYVRSLIEQYRVNRMELAIFTVIFILSMLLIPIAWFINHVSHDLALARLIAFVAVVLGLSMATHCGNTLNVLKRVTADLNREMGEHRTFGYDQGLETEKPRFYITLAAKVVGVLMLIWCFIRWPQL